MVKFVINLLALVGVFATGSALDCCLPGQVLSRDKQCQDVTTLAKSPVNIPCPKHMLVNGSRYSFFLNDNGELQFPLPNQILVRDDFCILKSNNSKVLSVLLCDEPEPLLDGAVIGYCLVVSTFFLMATTCRYVWVGYYRSLFGRSVINLCSSLALALLLLAIMKLMPYRDMNWCAVRGFSAYYLLLVSFFWMNAISLQTVIARRYGESSESSQSDQRRKLYALSALYAWGVPAVFTIITAVVNFMPGDHLKPGIGLNHCWFFNNAMQWEYMYSMISMLTVINIILFAILCCSGGSHNETFKNKLANRVQLFVVMGIPWIFEMIGSLTPPHLAWDILDVLNSLQGVWIFVVLVLLRIQERRPKQNTQYINNIINAEAPYHKLEK